MPTGTARAAVTEYDEIEHALEEVSKVVNKTVQDCGKALEIYNGLLAVMKKKTPKEYGEYLQKKDKERGGTSEEDKYE